jgi:hypothetical protein
MNCRPLGSPGYQYPDLVAALSRDAQSGGNGDIWVQTDRFALAVAICELMVWSDSVDTMLQNAGREQLLADEAIMKRDLSGLPKSIVDSFPEGFQLLQKALQATGPATMPSPEDWLRVLGFEKEPWIYKGKPVITVFVRQGGSRAKYGTFRLSSPTGDLGTAVAALAGTSYEITDQSLEFRFPGTQMVKRRRDGRLADVTATLGKLIANPGDTFYVGTCEIEVADVA